jgi:hypothetical protein
VIKSIINIALNFSKNINSGWKIILQPVFAIGQCFVISDKILSVLKEEA